MLFKFDSFWKTILIIVAFWALYGISDFEFTVITGLALLLCAIKK
jgi:uncharacterized membrane protein